MRIVGIDPGYERLGIAVIELSNSTETILFSTCVRTPAVMPFPDRLQSIGTALKDILDDYHPDAAALEELYFAKNTTTALLVAEARGVLQYILRDQGIPCFDYHPNAIKIAIAGHGRATKEEVARMIPRLVRFESSQTIDDELDAIAVALTHLAHTRNNYPQV